MRWIAIVGVNHMASCATRRTIIAWMIICAEKVQGWIHQTRLLQSKENRIGPLGSSKTARTESFVGLSGILVFVWQPNFQTSFATALKHTQHIPRLGDFPTWNGIEQG